MDFLDSSCADLNFNLIIGEFSTDQFTHLEGGIDIITINGVPIKLEYQIIGESHFVKFAIDGIELTEVLACIKADIPKRSVVLTPKHKVIYINEIESENALISYFSTISIKNKNLPSFTNKNSVWSRRISQIFPKGDLPKEPITLVDIDKIGQIKTVNGGQQEEHLCINTLHAYPQDKKNVITETVLNITKQKRY